MASEDNTLPLVAYATTLLGASGQPNLVIGSCQPEQLIWTLANNQSNMGDLVVTPFQSGPVRQDHYHFRFQFTPGALTHPPTLKGWDVLAVEDGHGGINYVYIALSGNTPLRIASGDSYQAALIYTGAIQENSNSTNVSISLMPGEQVMLGDKPLAGFPFTFPALTLVQADTASLPTPPLAVDFVGRRTVLNDGETPNHFTFALTNMTPAALTVTPEVLFSVWFDAAGDDAKGGFPWALARVENLAKAKLDPEPPGSDADWSVTSYPTTSDQGPVSPQWEINAKRAVVLAPQSSVQFTFSGLKTNLDPGFTRMYLRFKNLPGFRPGV
jgi:hypothetical protein